MVAGGVGQTEALRLDVFDPPHVSSSCSAYLNTMSAHCVLHLRLVEAKGLKNVQVRLSDGCQAAVQCCASVGDGACCPLALFPPTHATLFISAVSAVLVLLMCCVHSTLGPWVSSSCCISLQCHCLRVQSFLFYVFWSPSLAVCVCVSLSLCPADPVAQVSGKWGNGATGVHKNGGKKPVWNQQLSFTVELGETLIMEVYNKALGGGLELICSGDLPVSVFTSGAPVDGWCVAAVR